MIVIYCRLVWDISSFVLIFPQWLVCSVTGHLLMNELHRREQGMSRHILSLSSPLLRQLVRTGIH